MSDQAEVHSIDALREFRVALVLFGDDVLAALGGVDMELRRTVQWVQHDRRAYWQEQIKRRRQQVAAAKAEVFRRKLAKTADYTPAFSEQKELLRKAEASLQDAEYRAGLVKKWDSALQQTVLEYHGSTRRISNLASGDVPRAMALLERMIEALEAYLRESSYPGPAARALLDSIAETALNADAASAEASLEAEDAGPVTAQPEDETLEPPGGGPDPDTPA